ncbi:YigZ family protein [candidate division KSB1 bacterium]|nr:YigZ family protein [candidate division KSB1 bacterium]
MNSSFRTLQSAAHAEVKIKGSRFIARALPVASRDAAESVVHKIRDLHPDATHTCFAYRVGQGEKEVTRFSDDGEPSGTAGKPILQAITVRDLTNVVVTVTRYFGGIKLGTGGLVRAYGGSAYAALDQGSVVEYFEQIKVDLEYTYDRSHALAGLAQKYGATILTTDYGERIRQSWQIRRDRLKALKRAANDATSGQILFRVGRDLF